MGIRERASSGLKNLSSIFTGMQSAESVSAVPAEVGGFEDITDINLKGCLVNLNSNITRRVSDSIWATDIVSYYNLYIDPFGIRTTQVKKLLEKFRGEKMIVPCSKMSKRTNQYRLAYEREHLLAIGALIWANSRKSVEEPDIVAIAHKAVGESPIKEFIHKARQTKPASNRYQGKPSHQQLNDVKKKEPAELQEAKKEPDSKDKDVLTLAYYTPNEIEKLFSKMPNDSGSVYVLTDRHLPQGVNASGRSVVLYSDLYYALMEIDDYRCRVKYNRGRAESLVEALTIRELCVLLKNCKDGFELKYENVGEILEAIRKDEGV